MRWNWRYFRAACIRLPKRWVLHYDALLSLRTSKSGATIPARFLTAKARVIAMGDHMPVHLGSMPMSVQAAIDAIEFEPGDIAILNDPYAGGTHLPDITMVLPVFVDADREPAFYVANRAHHADVGGTFRGIDGARDRNFSGRDSHPSGTHRAARRGVPRDSRFDSAECAHSE